MTPGSPADSGPAVCASPSAPGESGYPGAGRGEVNTELSDNPTEIAPLIQANAVGLTGMFARGT